MRSVGVIAVFAALVVIGGYLLFAGSRRDRAQAGGGAAAPAAGAVERGRVVGAFDPKMTGVCRFSCAAAQPFDEAELGVQPGALRGALTRCPVSGVVFAVDEGRPRVSIETGDYVFCCDICAKKFTKEPGRFVSL